MWHCPGVYVMWNCGTSNFSHFYSILRPTWILRSQPAKVQPYVSPPLSEIPPVSPGKILGKPTQINALRQCSDYPPSWSPAPGLLPPAHECHTLLRASQQSQHNTPFQVSLLKFPQPSPRRGWTNCVSPCLTSARHA